MASRSLVSHLRMECDEMTDSIIKPKLKERPILMSAPMIRALLAGTKTQTRRAVKGTALEWLQPGGFVPEFVANPENHLCPYGVPGDHLWCREAFIHEPADYCWEASVSIPSRPATTVYRADHDERESRGAGWKPSIHMPRSLSRILLEVTDVRVDRLQDISEADALAEGIMHLPRLEGYGLPDGSHFHAIDPRISYWSLWDSINGQGATEANPWVWCVSFRRIEGVT